MKKYYRKRPEYYVFTYEETEILPKDVRNQLTEFNYTFHITSTQINDTTVERVLWVKHYYTKKEWPVYAGNSIIFDMENRTASIISPFFQDLYEEAT